MNKYPFFRYITGDSKVHSMNSKLKILSFLVNLLCIIIYKDYISLLIIGIALLLVAISSKINFEAYFTNIVLVWPIYVLVMLLSFFITKYLLVSILITLKFVLTIFLFLILTFTTSLSEIAWGFECLFLKLKKIGFPVSKVSLKIAMDIKFVSTVFEQNSQIRKSMAYRGVSYDKSFITSFKKMLIPVISLSYRTSRRLAKTMKLRFYGSSKRRTNYHENKVTGYDKWLVVLSNIILYVTIWLGWC